MFIHGLLREIVASHVRYLFWILSAAGRKDVMRNWFRPDIPTVDDWIGSIHDIVRMKRIPFSLRLQLHSFLKR